MITTIILGNLTIGLLIAIGIVLFARFNADRPALIHLLWVLLLIKLVTVPIVFVSVPGLREVIELTNATGGSSEFVATTEAHAAFSAQVPVTSSRPSVGEETLENNETTTDQIAIPVSPQETQLPIEAITPQAADTGARIGNVSTSNRSLWELQSFSWTSVLLGTWLAGSLLYVIRTAVLQLRFRRLLAHAVPPSNATSRLVAEIASDIGLSRPPRVVMLDMTISPLVDLGLSGHRLLLPTSLVDQLDEPELGSLVAHELAHVRRRDPLVRWLELVAMSIYWWCPLLWYARIQLHTVEELACDAIAVERSKRNPGVYAGAFLKTIDFLGGQSLVVSPCTCTANSGRACEQRLQAILNQANQATLTRYQLLLVSACALLLIPLGVSTVDSAQTEPTNQQTVTAPAKDGTNAPEEENVQDTAGAQQSVVNDKEAETAANPKVVSVFPANGAVNVATKNVIKIRFDQPMDPNQYCLAWERFGSEGGFRLRASPTYDAELHEFSFPVLLKPTAEHSVGTKSSIRAGFISTSSVPAEPYSWKFTAKDQKDVTSGDATVLDIDPKPDAEIPLFNLLRVRFDQPMNPDWYEVVLDPEADGDPFHKDVEVLGDVTYEAKSNEFLIPVKFPANWNGTLQLRGFVDANGNLAVEKNFLFRTMRTSVSSDHAARLTAAAKSPETEQLLQKILDRQKEIISVEVTSSMGMIFRNRGWAYEVNSSGATFAKHGKKFVGNVSQIMNLPKFVVGSDGTTCWFRSSDKVTTCPSAEIANQYVSIANLFGVRSFDSPTALVEKLPIEYLGDETFNGKQCHRLRAWTQGNFADWLIDSNSLLPVYRTAQTFYSTFRWKNTNQPIDEDRFAVPKGVGIQRKPAEPLDEGYDQRYLNVSDGTNGRMSLRWGKRGKSGSSSSGLN